MAPVASTLEKVVAMAPITKDMFHMKITGWKKDLDSKAFEWQGNANELEIAMGLAGHFLNGKGLERPALETAVGLFKAAILLRQYGKKDEAEGAAKKYVTAMFAQRWYPYLAEDAGLLGVEAHLSELGEAVRLIDKKMARGDLVNAGKIAKKHGLLWHLWELAHSSNGSGDISRLETALYMMGIVDEKPELPIVPSC